MRMTMKINVSHDTTILSNGKEIELSNEVKQEILFHRNSSQSVSEQQTALFQRLPLDGICSFDEKAKSTTHANYQSQEGDDVEVETRLKAVTTRLEESLPDEVVGCYDDIRGRLNRIQKHLHSLKSHPVSKKIEETWLIINNIEGKIAEKELQIQELLKQYGKWKESPNCFDINVIDSKDGGKIERFITHQYYLDPFIRVEKTYNSKGQVKMTTKKMAADYIIVELTSNDNVDSFCAQIEERFPHADCKISAISLPTKLYKLSFSVLIRDEYQTHQYDHQHHHDLLKLFDEIYEWLQTCHCVQSYNPDAVFLPGNSEVK